MADITQAVLTSPEAVVEAKSGKETSAEPVSESAEADSHGAEAGGIGNHVGDNKIEKKENVVPGAVEPPITSAREPVVEKKEETVISAPDPPVPAAPVTSDEASASDPAISVPPVAPATEPATEPVTAAATTTAVETKSAPPPPTAEAPDPDEDDLDDLDEFLDEFSAANISAQEPQPAASGPGRPEEPSAPVERDAAHLFAGAAPPPPTTTNPAFPSFPVDPLLASSGPDDDEFAAQLQAGMADLLSEMESSPEMQQQFESMIRELGGTAAAAAPGAAPGSASGSGARDLGADAASSTTTASGGPPLSFQDTIQRTMERMHNSDATAHDAAASASQADQDFMATLLREMESGGAGGEGSEEDFSKMLLGMMEQLTNKDILYEPMKELDTKFPDWLLKNKDTVSKEDRARYEEQQRLVGDIVKKFEEPGYSDSNVESRQYIVDKMQKMQAAGSPPADLVGDMDAASEALGDLDSGCPTQ